MAESPEPRESLIKREADLPAADPIASKSTSGWMMVSALLLTISIAWALYDEAFVGEFSSRCSATDCAGEIRYTPLTAELRSSPLQ